MVAEQTGTDHHELSVKPNPLSDLFEIVRGIDEPVADPSVFPTYYICQEARKHVTVCLTGLGGDEVFRGYPWLQDNSALDTWFRLPRNMRSIFYRLTESTRGRLASASADLRKYEELDYGSLNPRERCVARLEHYPPKSLRIVHGGSVPDRTFSMLMDHVQSDADARDYLTVKSILPNDYLHKDDRLSMANSLELRSPLLDHVLAPLCLRFPSILKSRGGVSKYILKKFAVRELGLPRHAIYRRKVGFAIPLEGLHQDMLPEVEELNCELQLLPRQQLGELTNSRPSHENSGRVFAILLLLRWCADNDISVSSHAG
jgi:asparagine synthase (glutamine-hydrolysing)